MGINLINDADYKVSLYEIVDGKSKQIWICPIYDKWKKMWVRCESTKYHSTRKTYIDASVCDEWKIFSAFKNWIESLPIESKYIHSLELDKDLKSDNKLYSPDTCLLIPSYINNAVRVSAGNRGEYPLGVSLDNSRKPYKSSIRKFGKLKNLGRFDNITDAHKAWQLGKIEYLNEIIEKYKTEEFYYLEVECALMDIINKIQYEYNNNIVTEKL